MKIEDLNGRTRLEIKPTSSDEAFFCETIARLMLHRKLFLLAVDADQVRLDVRTGCRTEASLPLCESQAAKVHSLLSRDVTCMPLFNAGYEAGCIIAG